ncbi:MAG: PUR family DNA/RNA-binding protein [Tannerella sp.]|nr:PUR family DNA/RNA-binding protein [Tannerella sp.]
MEELTDKTSGSSGDKEIVYSKAIKAGKRIYYLDVKKNLKDDLFIAITESKRNHTKEGESVTFEKHKIFLYKEDFEKFMDGMNEIMRFIKEKKSESSFRKNLDGEL